MHKAEDLIAEGDEINRLKSQLAKEKQNTKALLDALQRTRSLWSSTYVPPKRGWKKSKPGRHRTRISVGDLHGNDQHLEAREAFLNDLEVIKPDQGVLGGDIVNCSGTFSRFHRVHVTEFSYSYEDDIAAGNDFLDECQRRSPKTEWFYIQGNHESRIDKWAAATFNERWLAQRAIDTLGPKNVLHLDKRGIHYFASNECHMGLHKPGMIVLGKCGYLHGYGGGKHVAYHHLLDLGMNTVHFHNHRSQSHIKRTAQDSAIGAWCPGCLCILQQYWNHEKPTDHTHGYNLQFEDPKTGWFSSNNISIFDGRSLLDLVEIK